MLPFRMLHTRQLFPELVANDSNNLIPGSLRACSSAVRAEDSLSSVLPADADPPFDGARTVATLRDHFGRSYRQHNVNDWRRAERK
jgi:hypothetical protein